MGYLIQPSVDNVYLPLSSHGGFTFKTMTRLSCGLKSILISQLDDYDYPHKYQWFNPCWLSTNEKI